MSEATAADLVRVATEMITTGSYVIVNPHQRAVNVGMLRGRFGSMKSEQFYELLAIAVNAGNLTYFGRDVVALTNAAPQSKYDKAQTDTATQGIDLVADAFRKLGVVRDKLNGKCTEVEYRALVHDVDEIRDQLETWLTDRDYVASIP